MSGDSVRVAQPLFPVEGQGSIPMSPLQFEIVQIETKLAKQLNKLWHSRLPLIYSFDSKICYGLEYKNILFAVSVWSHPVSRYFSVDTHMELRRMAISPEAPKNTASRFIKLMIINIKKKFINVHTLLSYQDTEVHTGTIYKASGWKKKAISTKPNWKTKWPYTQRNEYQSTAPKIRWEKQIRSEPEPEAIIKPPKKIPQKGLFF